MLPVILSGGSGTRLWPLSRAGYPKQFLSLTDEDSLFQSTLKRLAGLADCESPLAVCNSDHRFLIAEQARAIGVGLGDIVLEPLARNTAPAVALAALIARASGADPLLLVLPSDHAIARIGAFQAAVSLATPAALNGSLVTFGIAPLRPETGYGYIKSGAPRWGGGNAVERFVEKPNLATAERYLADGGYYWNSGMFLFRASVYLRELELHAPKILQACQAAVKGACRDLDFFRVDMGAFECCPSDSVDYAVMEKTTRAVVYPIDAGWSDVGSWNAVWEIAPQDARGNAARGDVLLEDGDNNFVHADSRLVALLGVSDLVVVETSDAVMVTQKSRTQDLKTLVTRLTEGGRSEATTHRKVYRPWGSYDVIDEGSRFKVKHLVVKPGERLSVQLHAHRAEHWVVVSGTAHVVIDGDESLVSENESIFIQRGARHSLENSTLEKLELIEVQTGAYLGEDDIIRFDDRYGRACVPLVSGVTSKD